MARQSKVPAKKGAEEEDQPLEVPKTRPGTSGTENLLTTNRRQASANFQRAARAERAYKAKKRSAAARTSASEARTHFAEAARHFARGIKKSFGVLGSLPYVFGEWEESMRAKQDEKKRERAVAQRKKLEEQLALADEEAKAEGKAENEGGNKSAVSG
jgi:hypothetical protein